MPVNIVRPVDFQRPWYAKAISLLPENANVSVVELGSGNGELARLTKNRFKSLTLVDINPGKNVVRADLNQPLPFVAGKFSGVISLEVIEHLIDHELFLKEIHRILKPKGWLIISTPNIAWWGYRLFMLLGQPPKKEGYHLRFFTHFTLIKYLNQAGFKIKDTRSFTTLPFINRWLPRPIYPTVKFLQNLLVQDLVFICRKK
jgi:2-polyprenyl-3-methyl-5-hydroxy-6-metoxy-1,4-benzoquinol methylase